MWTENVDNWRDECSEAYNGAHLEHSRTRQSMTGKKNQAQR